MHSLGVHVVLDLVGRMRFGPDVEFLPERTADYTVNPSLSKAFAASARRILPFIKDEDMTPDMSGIRPKLQGQKDAFRDFVIAEESSKGLPGFINLVGIESPGLTASPAIAKMVAGMVRM
jgi:L-2-hydroxyglutarate oxidase LhgO